MLRPRIPQRLMQRLPAGLAHRAGGGEAVGWVEEGADGAETEGVGDGAGEDDGGDELLEGVHGGGCVCL